MATALYDNGRQKFLEGDIHWLTDTIKAVLVDVADYTVNLATDDFLDDVPAAARVSTSAALTGKTSTAGVANAASPIFTAVTGDPCEAMIIIKDTGSAATSPLIGYIDSGVGLPVIPNGSNVIVAIDTGSNKLFKL